MTKRILLYASALCFTALMLSLGVSRMFDGSPDDVLLNAQVVPGTYKALGQPVTYGRSDGWYMDSSYNAYLMVNGSSVAVISSAGAFDFTGGDITMQNDATIGNATNGAITFTEASEDLVWTFTTNDVAVTTSTGVTELDLGTINLETDEIDANGTGTLTMLVNGEDVVLTGTSNLVTFSSSTGATIAFTPAVAITGALTVTGVVTPTGGVVAAGGWTAFPDSVHTLAQPAYANTDGTNAAFVATEYYVSELFVPCNMSVTGIKIFNGATVGTDSIHAALAYSDGTIVSGSATGADVTAGADAYQSHAFTGGAITVVGPASYFVVFIPSSTTDKYNAHTSFPGVGRAGKVSTRTYAAITAFTPPTTFTADLGPMASLY